MLEAEFLEHGDLVQEDFTDTYLNLTVKSVLLLKWFSQAWQGTSVPPPRFLLKESEMSTQGKEMGGIVIVTCLHRFLHKNFCLFRYL